MINQNWVFGRSAGLDFSGATPTAQSGYAINTSEGCASISDQAGNLLFYTDGVTVWDDQHVVRATGLLGNDSSTQSAIIVPAPGVINEYYIFTIDGTSYFSNSPHNHLNGIRINTSTWSFTQLVDHMVNPLNALPNTAEFSPAEKITAIQHANCRDFWVITLLQRGEISVGNGLGTFRVLLVTSNGVQYVNDTPLNVRIHELGYLKGSPNGKRLAIANGGNNNILVYPFDNSTGTISTSGLLTIQATIPTGVLSYVYGVEFSPNSNMLYYGNQIPTGFIFQVDLTATNLTSTLIGDTRNIGTQIGALQLGPDNRIYFTKPNTAFLGVINDPDLPTASISGVDQALVGTGIARLGLPNLIPNYCGGDDDCNCGCTGCNDDADLQNEELIERAIAKSTVTKSNDECEDPFSISCSSNAVAAGIDLHPCFYFHWGDGANDQIEEHDTEVFYLTVCNNFNDIQYNGLRITKITLTPDIHPLDKIQIVPDRFVSFDCLTACSCQTREFAIITRANDTAGNYSLSVEYCYEGISIISNNTSGVVEFPLEITED